MNVIIIYEKLHWMLSALKVVEQMVTAHEYYEHLLIPFSEIQLCCRHATRLECNWVPVAFASMFFARALIVCSTSCSFADVIQLLQDNESSNKAWGICLKMDWLYRNNGSTLALL
jgi:hypothetical protein